MMTALSDRRRAIVFDTETTGLIENSAVPLKSQPHIIELTAIKLDLDDLHHIQSLEGLTPERISEFVDKSEMFTSLFHHGKLPEDTTKITGITQEMVNLAPAFPSKLRELQRFFLGTGTLVGHNLSFDRDMLELELRRLDAACQFPWPPKHICTVEATETLDGFRLGLNDLHEKLLGFRFTEAHRSENDTKATARVFCALVRDRIIKL